MVKSTGACREAATVCPTSTWRETTTPLTGARIVVCSRSAWAWTSRAFFWSTWARAESSCASSTRSWATTDWIAALSDCSLAFAASSRATAES